MIKFIILEILFLSLGVISLFMADRSFINVGWVLVFIGFMVLTAYYNSEEVTIITNWVENILITILS